MYYIVEIGCVVAEVWMIHMFLSGFFERRTIPGWTAVLTYLVLGIFLIAFSLIEDMVYGRIFFATLAVFTISIVLFRASPFPGLISAVSFCAIFAVTDIISALAFNQFNIQNETLMSNHAYRSIYIIACHVIMLGLVLLVSLINRNKRSISPKVLLPAAPCWLVSLLLCFLLTWQCFVMHYELHPLFIFVLLGLLYVSIAAIYYTNRMQKQSEEKRKWEIAEHHYAMQQEYYDELRIQQEETRALWHDLSKYIRASEIDTSDGSIHQFQEMLDSISCVVDVKNRVVSVILNEYVKEARAAQIEFEMDVLIPEELGVTAADLYILIGNTMDNAIEACQSLPVEQRKISLKLKKHNSILFYEISNPFDEGHVQKAHSIYHGFGLKNVERCIEKYNGKMVVSKTAGIFQIEIYLNSF